MSIDNSLNVTHLLGYRLKQTQHALRLLMDEAMRALDLTTPQYAVLAQLEVRPGISNAALARSSFITPQTMCGIVSNLEKRGLIRRNAERSHGRMLYLELTPQGSDVVHQAHALISQVEARMTASMSQEKKLLLEELLAECFRNLA